MTNSISFRGKILSKQNKKLVSQMRSKIYTYANDGIPTGNVLCKVPEKESITLFTVDKKTKIAFSSLGDNLIISQRHKNRKRAVSISPKNDVLYAPDYDDDFIDVKPKSRLVPLLNTFLSNVLTHFLK